MGENFKVKGYVFCLENLPGIQEFQDNIQNWGYKLTFIQNFEETLCEKAEEVVKGQLDAPVLFIIPENNFLNAWNNDNLRIKYLKRKLTAIITINQGDTSLTENISEVLVDELEIPLKESRLKRCLNNAEARIQLEVERANLRKELGKRTSQMQEINRIGISLTLERNLKTLLENILTKARQLTSADAGSLYLIDKEKPETLRFVWAQNDTINVEFNESTIAIDSSSIVGCAVITSEIINIPNAYEIPDNMAYKHNSDRDKSLNYKTVSVLCVPIKKIDGQILGCIQLINRKSDSNVVLPADTNEFENYILAFDTENQLLLSSFASQAAVALENNFLIKNIENLFDNFIKASVAAIEFRDPATSGHSERVAELAIIVAEAVSGATTGKYADVIFDENQLKELKYAALLHDFGKVAVKEEILTKQNKLYDYQLELIKWRIEVCKKIQENLMLNNIIDSFLISEKKLSEKQILDLKGMVREKHKELDELYNLIQDVSKPKQLSYDKVSQILKFKKLKLNLTSGASYTLLTDADLENLMIYRGSLNPNEKKKIESHVEHTYKFLQQIPWMKEFEKIPEIAGGHHEKLDGKGYPTGKIDTEILLESKILTVVDIFDALTATDRPYTKGVPFHKAIDILREEATLNKIDAELVEIFADLILKKKRQARVFPKDSEHIEVKTHYITKSLESSEHSQEVQQKDSDVSKQEFTSFEEFIEKSSKTDETFLDLREATRMLNKEIFGDSDADPDAPNNCESSDVDNLNKEK